jgi:AraC-like DNA-binding protein
VRLTVADDLLIRQIHTVKSESPIMIKQLIKALGDSKIYQEYERAFNESTGLTLALRSVEMCNLPQHGERMENPFCALMTKTSLACAAGLEIQQQPTAAAPSGPRTITCRLGLTETAVPIRMGNQLIGFLSTGLVFRNKPTEAQFVRVAKQLAEWGIEADTKELRAAYFGTRVLSARQHESIVKLLTIFAQHLSLISNQIVVQEQNNEPPFIARAKQFISDNQCEELSLNRVAKAVNMSSFYFCKKFKKFTGINFTEYITRMRIEKSRNLLLNPNLRISEIAYEVGFQSLTHFNRMFKRVLGSSPTDYRLQFARN